MLKKYIQASRVAGISLCLSICGCAFGDMASTNWSAIGAAASLSALSSPEAGVIIAATSITVSGPASPADDWKGAAVGAVAGATLGGLVLGSVDSALGGGGGLNAGAVTGGAIGALAGAAEGATLQNSLSTHEETQYTVQLADQSTMTIVQDGPILAVGTHVMVSAGSPPSMDIETSPPASTLSSPTVQAPPASTSAPASVPAQQNGNPYRTITPV